MTDEYSAIILSHQELYGLKQILMDIQDEYLEQEYKAPAYVESLLKKVEHTTPLPPSD